MQLEAVDDTSLQINHAPGESTDSDDLILHMAGDAPDVSSTTGATATAAAAAAEPQPVSDTLAWACSSSRHVRGRLLPFQLYKN